MNVSPVRGLDWVIFFTFGVDLFIEKPCNKSTHLVLKLIKITLITWTVNQALLSIWASSNVIFAGDNPTFEACSYCVFDLCGFIYFFSILFRQKSLVKLFKLIANQSQVKRTHLTTMSLLFTLLSILLTFVLMESRSLYAYSWLQVRTVGFTFNQTNHPNLQLAVFAIASLAIIQKYWILMSPIVYCVILSALYCSWKERLEKLASALAFLCHLDCLETVDQIEEEVQQFENCFSVHPLLWLVYIFVRISGLLVTSSYNVEYARLYWLEAGVLVHLFIVLVTITSAIGFTSSVKIRLDKEKELLNRTIERKIPSAGNLTLLHKIDSAFASIQFTVCSMTPVSISLLFSYMASVLSFSVLLAQIQIQFNKPYNETNKYF